MSCRPDQTKAASGSWGSTPAKAVWLIVTCLVLFLPPPVFAQSLTPFGGSEAEKTADDSPNAVDADAADVVTRYEAWKSQLGGIAAAISGLEKSGTPDSAVTERLARQIEDVLGRAGEVKASAEAALENPVSALAALGPAPEADQPPEAAVVLEKREELERQRAYLAAQIAFVRLIDAEAETLVERLALLTERSFADWIFSRESLRSWPGVRDISAMITSITLPDLAALTGMPVPWHVALSLGLIALTMVSFFLLMPRIRSARRYRSLHDCPDRLSCAKSALLLATGDGLLPSALCLALAWLIMAGNFLPEPVSGLLLGLLAGLAFYLTTCRLFRTAIAPSSPAWRMVDMNDETAARLHFSLWFLSVAIALFIAVYVIFSLAAAANRDVLLVFKMAAVIAVFASAVVFGRAPLWLEDSRSPRSEKFVRAAIVVVVAGLFAAAAFGYVNFAFFIAIHIAGTALILFSAYFARPILHDGLRIAFSRDADDFDRDSHGFAEVSLRIALDLSVLLVFGLLLLGFWGLPLQVLWLWASQVAGDFSVGKLTLGLNDIFFAIVVFAGVLVLVRILHRVVRRRLLAHLPIDSGIRDSVDVALGYVGFIIAAISGIAALGVSLSSIALLLGALSLGVGFGLQNIVDNFVSGLVLLIQRPIKAGDWISVERHEGFVKRIGVVSTEISTFEESSVIIPNSELISSAVVNRTLGLSRGRVDIGVGVAYGSDVSKVFDILRRCADGVDLVLESPEPDVVLLNFNDSTLDFELRAFIADIRDSFAVATDLRVSILDAFREQDIEIPFPQRDLHVRTVNDAVAHTLGARTDFGDDGSENRHDASPRDKPEDRQ